MTKINKKLDTNRLYYYVDLYSQKVELGTKYFMMRVDALLKNDKEKVEFIENMFLKPADMQAAYAAQKILDLFN
jgi:hypothetical protein